MPCKMPCKGDARTSPSLFTVGVLWVLSFLCLLGPGCGLHDFQADSPKGKTTFVVKGCGASSVDSLLEYAIHRYTPKEQRTFDCQYGPIERCSQERESTAAVYYGSYGSGLAKSLFLNRTENEVQLEEPPPGRAGDLFGLSESLFLQEDYDKHPDVLLFPLLAVGVVPIYNIEGVGPSEIRLRKQVLSRIFRGNITTWDDPDILETNQDILMKLKSLRDKKINVFVRIDESGTTELWTEALSHFDSEFASKIGVSPKPKWNGVEVHARASSDGVLAGVLSTDQSIGYVSLAEASKLHVSRAALVVDEAGLKATVASASVIHNSMLYKGPASLERFADVNVKRQPTKERNVYIPVPDSPHYWPITGYTYLVTRRNYSAANLPEMRTCEDVREVIKFWSWFLQADLVRDEAAALTTFVMPEHIVKFVVSQLHGRIYCNGTLPYELHQTEKVALTAMSDLAGRLMDRYEGHFPIYSHYPVELNKEQACKIDESFFSTSDILIGLTEISKSSTHNMTKIMTGNDLDPAASHEFLPLPFGIIALGIEFNIEGYEDELLITKELEGKIVLKQISRWNDPSLVELNPGLAGISDEITIFLSEAYLECLVDQSPPDDKNERTLYSQAAHRGLIPGVHVVKHGEESMHVMENKNSLAITTLPDYNVRGHAVLRQERKFAYHVPDAVQAMDISRQEMLKIVASKTGSGFCAELPYADFLYQYSICNILAVMQVNIYAKHTYARTRSQRCTIAEDVVNFIASVIDEQKDRLMDPNLGFIPFGKEVRMEAMKKLKNVNCDGKSVLCGSEKFAYRDFCSAAARCTRNYTMSSCTLDFSPRQTLTFFEKEVNLEDSEVQGDTLYNGKQSASHPDLPIDQQIHICATSNDTNNYEVELACDHVPKHSSLGLLLCSLSGLFILFQLLSFICLFSQRRSLYVIAGQPLFNCLMILGNITCLSYIPLSIGNFEDWNGPNVNCFIRHALISVGWTMTCSAIVCKPFRIYHIYHNKHLVPTKIVGKDLIKYWLLPVAVDISFLIISWLTCNPAETNALLVSGYGASGISFYYVVKCKGFSWISILVTYSYKAMLTLFGLVMCWKTKKVISVFSEAKLSAIVLYNGTVTSALALLVMNFGSLEENEILILQATAIYFFTASNVIILVWPRYLEAIGFITSENLGKTENFFVETWSSGSTPTLEENGEADGEEDIPRDEADREEDIPRDDEGHPENVI